MRLSPRRSVDSHTFVLEGEKLNNPNEKLIGVSSMLKVIPKKPQPGCSAPVWRRQRPYKKLLACVGLVSVAAGWTLTATAGDHFYNFDPPNGDPATSGFILYGANAANAWHTNNGASGTDTDGFLEITPARLPVLRTRLCRFSSKP